MNVKRKEKYVPLGDLEPGQRFRRKDDPTELWQVGTDWRPSMVTEGSIAANRDCDGKRDGWVSHMLVEHIPGHWQPEDEEEGLVAIGDVDIFAVVDFDGEWWVHTNEGADSDCRCLRMLGKPSSCRYIRQERLVRVVHGTFVEDGAKIEGVGHE